MNNLNIDYAVECVKLLADNNRCELCDQLFGAVVRYPCGHCVCETCVLGAEECLRCLSPPITSINSTDVPYSNRIKHVSELLTAFQDFFQLDVYKRHRLSDKLKLEKQLFPQCIQAPVKYINKRKSISTVANDKENLRSLVLPGEHILKAMKMDETINYVQQWLNKNESSLRKSNTIPRKPFADINVNGQNNTKDQSLKLFKREINTLSSRKRTHKKVLDTCKNKNLISQRKKKKQELDLQCRPQEDKKISETVTAKCENDESGIVINDSIIIEDSQSAVEKNNLALNAIREAQGFYSCDNTNNNDLIENNSKLNNIIEPISNKRHKCSFYKTPFYRKSMLYKFCNECKFEILKHKTNSRYINISIDSNSYTTIIKLTQCHSNMKVLKSKSVEVQTESNINLPPKKKTETKINENFSHKYKENTNSDLLKNTRQTFCLTDENNENIIKTTEDANLSKRAKNVVIEDSDSNSDVVNSESHSFVVTAEVHKSFDDFGVLSEIDLNELENRPRHAVRGGTPLSTDSSDKENYDPNRVKRQKITKKYCVKK